MTRIIAKKVASFHKPGQGVSFRIDPNYGVVKHLPQWVVDAAVDSGDAEIVPSKKSPKGVTAEEAADTGR